ncbi:methyltransferase [Halioxenophilus sp. WMMB6]|uniref:class I SAM-dependent methyltransferase n=1 Tax=Halioxenophilus sp. WMMB6 TaxID=3073815 RepID=UPI00295F023E|nr:methyltransferase [Halioxenophilus sp. WMMB6]
MRYHRASTGPITTAVFLLSLFSGGSVLAESTEEVIRTALESEVRTDDEKARDSERKPLETLTFFGLEPDMKVIELMPGHGWYTKVLGNVLKEKGQLYEALNTGWVRDDIGQWNLGDVQFLALDSKLEPTDIKGIFHLKSLDFGVKDVDMVITFRNTHNFDDATRALVNKQVFEALKPGGIYAVVDHTRRHNEPYSRPVWRRLDPVMIIKEALDAGFVFEDYSDLHYQPTDKLVFDTTDEQMVGHSDRFTLKFRKPE